MAEIGEEWGEQASEAKPGDPAASIPTLDELQHWTGVLGQAQQMILEHFAENMNGDRAAMPMIDPALVPPIVPNPESCICGQR